MCSDYNIQQMRFRKGFLSQNINGLDYNILDICLKMNWLNGLNKTKFEKKNDCLTCLNWL